MAQYIRCNSIPQMADSLPVVLKNGTIRLWNAADNRSARILMTGNGNSVFFGSILSKWQYDLGRLQVSSVVYRPTLQCGRWRWQFLLGQTLGTSSRRFFEPCVFSRRANMLASSSRGDGTTVCFWNSHEKNRKQFKHQVDWETIFLLLELILGDE